jgi:hypothetical protein
VRPGCSPAQTTPCTCSRPSRWLRKEPLTPGPHPTACSWRPPLQLADATSTGECESGQGPEVAKETLRLLTVYVRAYMGHLGEGGLDFDFSHGQSLAVR